MDMLEKLSLAGLVPVIKVEDAQDAVPLCKALADGGLPVADFLDFLELPENALDTESYTLGGWTIEEFGSFPKAGDSFRWREFTITVLEMDEDGRRVEKVLARREEE